MNILYANEILSEIPLSDFAREDQLCLEFPFVFMTSLIIGLFQVFFAVKPDNFPEHFVGTIEVLVLDIQHRIDAVLFQPRSKPVLPSKAGEQAALVPRV